jgi:hypothetical protein
MEREIGRMPTYTVTVSDPCIDAQKKVKIASAMTRRLVANKVFDFSHDLHTRWIPFRVEGAGSIHRGDKSRIGPHFRANHPVRRLSTERSIVRGIWIVRLAHFICNHFDIIAARSGIGTRYAEAENKPGDRQLSAHQTLVPGPLDLGGR